MITRQQYMENSSELHQAYYKQFVTPATLAFVKGSIGLDKLRTSKCPHFNDIIKHKHGGGGWVWDYTPMNMTLARSVGECDSLSTRTCVGKAAARLLLEE